MWAVVIGGELVEVVEQPRSIRIEGVLFPAGIFRRWDAERLAKVNVWPVIDSGPAEMPRFYRQKGQSFQVNTNSRWVTRTVQIEAIPLEEAKAQALVELESWRRRQIDRPVAFEGSEFSCDLESRVALIGAALEALIETVNQRAYSVKYRDARGATHQLDAPRTIGLGQAAAAQYKQRIEVAGQKRQAIEAAQTVEEVTFVLASLES